MKNLLLPFATTLLLLTSFATPSRRFPDEIKTQFHGLRQILKAADESYFEKHESLLSNDAYDLLRAYYEDLLESYPELAHEALPDFTENERNKVEHKKPVLSLKKVYSDEKLLKFCKSFSKPNGGFLLEPKIDGASIVVRYRNGKLVEAITRGNSLSGVDVTAVILASDALPLSLQSDAPAELEIRGEVFITKSHFNAINEERIERGEEPYKHVRNLASGSLMLEDFTEVMLRQLQITIFEYRSAATHGWKQDSQALSFLRELGLPVIEFHISKSGQDLIDLLHELEPQRADYDFETDGWVIKVNDFKLRTEVGATQKYPRWAIARKFRSTPVITQVLRIEYSISESGTKTPIAILEPVEISGATIDRATLHSENFMNSMGIYPGCSVKVIRAGGVIPEIIAVVPGDTFGRQTGIHDASP